MMLKWNVTVCNGRKIRATLDFLESEEDEWAALNNRLEEEGFSQNLSDEKKLLCIWRWLVDAENNLTTSRKMLDKLRAQQAQEMQEVELFVEKLKDITDQRVDKVEEEKHRVVMELEKHKNSLAKNETAEINEMLRQEGLTDILHSSVSEQVAYLLVERARLLEEIALERESHKGMAANLTDNLKLGSVQIQQLLEKQKADFGTELHHHQQLSQHVKQQMQKVHETELQQLQDDLDQARKRIQELNSSDPIVRRESLHGHCQELEVKVTEQAERIKIMEKAMRQLENENETLVYKLSEALAECDEKETLLRNMRMKAVTSPRNNRRRTSVTTSPRAGSIASDSPKRLHELLDNKISTSQQELSWVEQIRKLQGEIGTLQQQLLKYGQQQEALATKYQRRKAHGKAQLQRIKDRLNLERNSYKSQLQNREREIVVLKAALLKEKSQHDKIRLELKKMLNENRQLSNRLLACEQGAQEKCQANTLLGMHVNMLKEEKDKLLQQASALQQQSTTKFKIKHKSSVPILYRQSSLDSATASAHKRFSSPDILMGQRCDMRSDEQRGLLDELSNVLNSVQMSLAQQGILPSASCFNLTSCTAGSHSTHEPSGANPEMSSQKSVSLTDLASLDQAETTNLTFQSSMSVPHHLNKRTPTRVPLVEKTDLKSGLSALSATSLNHKSQTLHTADIGSKLEELKNTIAHLKSSTSSASSPSSHVSDNANTTRVDDTGLC